MQIELIDSLLFLAVVTAGALAILLVVVLVYTLTALGYAGHRAVEAVRRRTTTTPAAAPALDTDAVMRHVVAR
ncbi:MULTISPECIES: hypothetical protein [Arthrobacter]|uniref:Oxaloacetate decarboxylase, gamma chain n=2 Tax=Arthrobacter TaxID=1663 RepID=A0ABU9KJN2_9MICC|nr:hypothetical protein [Arthrobacter sp. YJM1]MDP5226714.1 hypothetical protein [Arthrobacter sp. YJM1]